MKLLVILLVVGCFTFAQSPRSFEVATIKARGNDTRPGPQIQGERFLYGLGGLANLIQYAYDVESYQVIGAPSWAFQEMFDVQATAGTGVQLTDALSKEMLRNLLGERFGLRMHRERQEKDVLRLVTNGTPRLVPTDRKSAGFLMARDGAETKGASMAELSRMLQRFADRGRPIVDRTNLTGSYEFRLTFAASPTAAQDATVPDVVTALREQLNLRLETANELFDVWIIDSVERPSAN